MKCSVNCKRLGVAFCAVFAVIFITDFILHGILLKNLYLQTAAAWRTEAEMQGHMVWMVLGQALTAFMGAWIFAKGYEGKGLGEGVRFGLLMGGFSSGHCLIQYSVSPVPCSLLGAWVIGTVVQMTLVGVVAAAVYRK